LDGCPRRRHHDYIKRHLGEGFSARAVALTDLNGRPRHRIERAVLDLLAE
jgi:hypothetical protein